MAKALEVYEGLDSAILDTEGLGEKINKALAARIDQLKTLNAELDQTNIKLAISQTNLNEKISELKTTNENLNELNIQLDATNKKLEISENQKKLEARYGEKFEVQRSEVRKEGDL